MQTAKTITDARVKPILYSFRRCPYAIRARMALAAAGIEVEHREVLLKDKPDHMLSVSPKGTVPVLILPASPQRAVAEVLEESLDIVFWALQQRDPEGWLPGDALVQANMDELISECDTQFKPHLDGYKYAQADRTAFDFHRTQGQLFLQNLEQQLASQTGVPRPYLFGERVSVADVCVFPFVRQFAFVDKNWFDQCPYPHLLDWLDRWLLDSRFLNVMGKHPRWVPQNSESTTQ